MTILAPLRQRDFRLLWIGQSISQIGNVLYSVALPFQILALGGSPVQLGIGFALFSGVQLVSILFGGALVDRLPRRMIILSSDLASALMLGAVTVLSASGALRIEHLYVVSAFFGVFASLYLPAMNAIIPELVPRETLLAGNALRGLSRQTSRVIAPLVGGLLVVSAGPASAFGIDAASFFLSFAIFARAKAGAAPVPARRSLLASVREAIGFVISVRWIALTIFGFGTINLFYFGSLTVALPVLVRESLRGDALIYGALVSAAGAGEIVASLIVGNLRPSRLGVAMYLAYLATGIALVAYGATLVLPVIIGASAAFAGALVAANALWDSALQKHVPRELIGRVTSVDYFGSYLSAPLAPLVAAWTIERAGPGAVFIIGGVISVLFTLGVLLTSKSVRDLT